MTAVEPHAQAISSTARQNARAPRPAPPYASGTYRPISPCAPSRRSCSAGYDSVSSTCAASGAMRSRASARASSRVCRSFSPSQKASRMRRLSPLLTVVQTVAHHGAAVDADAFRHRRPGTLLSQGGLTMPQLRTKQGLAAALTVVAIVLAAGLYALAQQPYQLAPMDESKRDRGVSVSGAGGKFYVLPATLDTTQWGWLDPKEKAGPPINDAKGRTSTLRPWKNGSNMDINELQEGSILYLPVFVKGGLIWTGDSHCRQGNGEVNLTALECSYREFVIQALVRKDMKLDWPRIETPTHWIATGFDEDLNEAMKIATRETVNMLATQKTVPLSRDEAYALTSIVGDCRWSQVVDIRKGVHCMIPT